MIIFLICLVLSTLLFLFVLHVMTREDYALMRRNISMEQFYNIVFLALFCSVFFSRLCYVLFHFKLIYLNPVVFFMVVYFPGFSLFGSIIGLFLGLYLICLKKQYPWKKFFDFFSIGFACGLPLAAFGTTALHPGGVFLPIIASVIFYLVMGVIGFFVLYRRILVNKIKDGTTTIIFILSISAAYLIEVMIRNRSIFALKSIEPLLFILLFISQVVVLFFLFFRKRKARV